METSRPEKVLMKAAKAPAQVMPLKTEPQGNLRALASRPVEAGGLAGGRAGAPVPACPLSSLPTGDWLLPGRPAFEWRSSTLGNSSTTLSVPLAPAPV